MSTSLTTPSADGAGDTAKMPGESAVPPAGGDHGGVPVGAVAARSCAKCGSPMQPGQDWCLQCGAGVPGTLGASPGWRAAAVVLLATVLLVAGASVAAYAALNKSKPKPKVAAVTLKGATPVTPAAPGSTTAPSATTPSATAPGTPTTVKAAPPKIPLQTPTPQSGSGPDNEANNALFPPETKASKTPTPTTSTPTVTPPASKGNAQKGEGKSGSEGSSEAKGNSGHEAPSPILLDTDAASVYNPYDYPASLFSDPSLAIDGEAATAWTAQVQAADAPRMAEGLLLDLKSPQKLGSVAVASTSIGATVEVYGANASTPPTSISDAAWKRVVGLKVLKKKDTTLAFKRPFKSYRFILLWLAKAPPSSTVAAPGAVSIGEFELFPPS